MVVADGRVLIKIDADGELDPAFDGDALLHECSETNDLALDSSNRVVVGSSETPGCGGSTTVVRRLDPTTGAVDPDFDGTLPLGLNDVRIVSTAGAVVVSGVGFDGACLYRFREADGVLDATFGQLGTPGRACLPVSTGDPRARASVRPSGGYLLVAGTPEGSAMATLSTDGTIEGTPVAVPMPSGFASISAVTALPDGGTLLLGVDHAANKGPFAQRLDASAELVPAFNPSGERPGRLYLTSDDVEWSLAELAPGRFVLAGAAAGTARAIMIDLAGRTDTALESGGPVPGAVTVTPVAPATFSRFSAVTGWAGRVVLVGAEASGNSLEPSHHWTVIARSDVVGPPAIADTALFRPTQPTRILETRPGPDQVGYSGPKPAAGQTVELQVAGRAGMPASGIGAVAINLTATDATAPGFVTMWPSGNPRPLVSTLNLERTGQTLPNLAIVPVGANGHVSIYTLSGTHLIADVLGWFPAAGALHTIQPTRILETRPGPDQTGYAGAKPAPNSTVTLQVAGRAGLPPTGVAVAVLNVTVTEAEGPGFVSIWPSGDMQPMTSNLNVARTGQTIQNFVMVPVGQDGSIKLFTLSGAHLIADLVGWLPPNSGYVPTPQSPSPRVVDTRGIGPAMSAPVPGGTSIRVRRSNIQLLNVVAVQASGPGFLTVWPANTPRPTASNLNVEFAGQTIANAVLVRSAAEGFDIFTLSDSHIVADSFGTFPIPG
jgi:hypothetical protein